MKKITIFVLMLVAISIQTSGIFGQTRPKKRTAAPVSKTKAETPTEVEVAPVKKTIAAVSPAQVLFNQGLKCDAKDYDCQISNYTKAINLNLNTIDVFKNRGNAYLAKGDFEKGIGDFTKAIELDRNDVGGYKTRGKAFFETAKSDQDLNNALKDFNSAIELEPKDVEALNYRGLIYSMKNDVEKAAADFDKVISFSPNNVDAYINRGNVFLRLKKFDKAIENFNRAISLKPGDSDAYASRGYAYSVQNKNDLALKDLTKAIELAPTKAEAYGSRGEIYEKDKKYDEAIRDFTKAIELKPKSAYYLLRRGKSYQANKKNEEAISDFSKALELNPNNPKLLETRGMLYYNQKAYDKALEDFSKAIVLDGDLDEAYIYRGLARLGKGFSYDEQMKADWDRGYSNAIKNKTREIEIDQHNASAYQLRGNAYLHFKDYNKAADDLKKWLELDPNSWEPYLVLSEHYKMQGNYILALETLTKAIEKFPNSSAAYYYRGMVYGFLLKDHDKAVGDFVKGSEVATNDDPFKKNNLANLALLVATRKTEVVLEIMQKDARKAEKKRERTRAILQGVQTVTNVIANSSTPKTSPPVQQTPQPNTSGGQTSSTNASSTNSSTNTNNSSQNTSTTGGNTTPKRSWASIAQVPPPSESCSKSSYLPAGQRERCWGSWQATVFPQIQIRVKGPLATAGNLVNDDARYKATYYWYIQVKNTSNEIISVEDEIIFGDGKVTKQGFTVTPGGTAYHDTMTLSATETINIKLSNLESCKHWTKEGNMYRCSE
jgi:tetratricopeptide (TPR) repeat protein